MRKMPWPNRLFRFSTLTMLAVISFAGMLLLAGCKQDVVHQRSVADLNQKAQLMMQAGDYDGAVARLESAHDLEPDEVNTTYNLAIAYQMQGSYDKALTLFSHLQDKPGMNKAEILKAIGITCEAKGDLLDAQAREMEDNPKSDKTQLAEKKQMALETYQLALTSYQQALSGKGLKNPAEVQKQIDALQAKLHPPANAAASGAQP